MQVEYPKKLSTIHWDTLNKCYPVKKFPETGSSSNYIGHRWKNIPETIQEPKNHLTEEKDYNRDYNITKQLTRSLSSLDFGEKEFDRRRFNKHTVSKDNYFNYPLNKKLTDNPPPSQVRYATETSSSYLPPSRPSSLVTDKDQYKHPASLHLNQPIEPFHKGIPSLDTTYEGFEKYLDPYLTTSRLQHRPFTAEQLHRVANRNDVVTYYTCSKLPLVRSVKPHIAEWQSSVIRPRTMYDREKFKEEFREIRTHNKLCWVPGFRTETRDNYANLKSKPEANIHNNEEEVRSHYLRAVADLNTNLEQEQSSIERAYSTENSTIGSRKPLCSVMEQHLHQNKRVVRKYMK